MKNHVNVTVRRETHAALVAEAQRLSAAEAEGKRTNVRRVEGMPNTVAEGVSIDAVISYLLTFRERHRERSRKSRRKGSDG